VAQFGPHLTRAPRFLSDSPARFIRRLHGSA
jgi:hypothetical protein